MRNKEKIIVLVAALMLAALSTPADVISVNFFRTGNINRDGVAADFSGVVPGTWTNIVIATNGFAITDLGGTGLDISSSAGVTVAGNTNWANWVNCAGFGHNTAGSQVTMTLSDIPYDQYYIIVYLCGWNDRRGSLSDGSTTYYYTMPTIDGSNPPYLSQVTNTDSNSIASAVGTYVLFGSTENPLTADSLTMTVSAIQANVGIGGFQLVQVPEPAAVGTFVLGGVLVLLFRRLKQQG
ncbi:MAG: hypothetical protein WC959_02825 [Kiritimatiellales bacterium]